MFKALQSSYNQKRFQSGKIEHPTNVPMIGHDKNKSSSNPVHENESVHVH
jgi:hypothetical protein